MVGICFLNNFLYQCLVPNYFFHLLNYYFEKGASIQQVNLYLSFSGSFGKVYHYEDNEAGLHMAIKEITIATEQFPEHIDMVRKEININTKLRHENIVCYFGCYKGVASICIALELMDRSLKQKIHELEKQKGRQENEPVIPCHDIIRYTHGILSGLIFLHNLKIIHRDLRSPNILLSSTDVPKIGDFGISKELDVLTQNACFSTVQVGNIFWCPPEMADQDLTTESTRDSRVDVWSMGVVVLEMVHNIPPFMRSLHGYFKQLCMQKKGPDIPTFLSEDIKKVLAMCFTYDVLQRPYSKDIMGFVRTIYAPDRYDIFMSHNWGQNAANHSKVQIINEHLSNAGFCTWFDTDEGRMKVK